MFIRSTCGSNRHRRSEFASFFLKWTQLVTAAETEWALVLSWGCLANRIGFPKKRPLTSKNESLFARYEFRGLAERRRSYPCPFHPSS